MDMKPGNRIALKEGRDYTVSYKNYKKLSTDKTMASLTIRGKGAYSGSMATYYYRIVKRDLIDLKVRAYDRKESRNPKDYMKTKILMTDSNFIDQKYKAGKDYIVEWEEFEGAPGSGTEVHANIKAVEKKGALLTGETSVSFRILSDGMDIGDAKVKISGGNSMLYTGSDVFPSKDKITVKLKGKTLSADDYTIVGYYNVKDRGTATLLLKGNMKIAEDGTATGYGGYKIVKYNITSSPLKALWSGR